MFLSIWRSNAGKENRVGNPARFLSGLFFQGLVVYADVFVVPVFHQESFGDCAEEGEAEAFVEVAVVGVGFYYRVELQL